MTAPIRYAEFPDGRVRKVSLLRWGWTIRDGMTGPVLTAGVCRTERGAYRRMTRAARNAERRVLHVHDRVLHPLTEWEAEAISDDLAEAEVPVMVQVDDVVHLWALEPVGIEQEVRALYAVAAVTDALVRWHGYAAVST